MSATRIRRHLEAPRTAVHRALLDQRATPPKEIP